MSQPTAYYPSYNFTQYQVSHPSAPLPAASVDAELFSISASIAEICANLALIQRDDGALANGSVGMEQLATSLFTGVNAATVWATSTTYAAQMSVYQNNAVYLCAKAHTSGVFATDLAAGDWIVILDFSSYISAASGAATSASSSAAAAALDAARLSGTSATSLAISVASKSFTTQSGKFFDVGSYLLIVSDANPSVNFMHGQVTAYSGTALDVNVTSIGGSGTHTDWTLRVSGARGAQGPAGTAGAGTGDMLGANNLSDVVSQATSRTNLGLGTSAVQAVTFFCQAASNLSDVANAATAFAAIKQTGTSGATGVLQLATSIEAIAGTDTAKAVTSAGVAAAIAAHSSAGIATVKTQKITASGTYTPSAGMAYCYVVLMGGGGGGGSGTNGDPGPGSGGGAGGRAEKLFTAATIGTSQAVTIGAAGAAATNGGQSLFGALLTAHGGVKGAAGGASVSKLGGLGGTASGGDINVQGASGESCYSAGMSSKGGDSLYGAGGQGHVGAGVGAAAQGFGAGGGGAVDFSSLGGVGVAGVCYITEYCV